MRRPPRSMSPSCGGAAGVVTDGVRGGVWRAVAMQAHLLGPNPLSSGPPGLGSRLRGQRASSARASSPSTDQRSDRRARSSSLLDSGGGRSRSSRPARILSDSQDAHALESGAEGGAALHAYAQLDYAEKLRRHQASMTLAQRMGLVAQPAGPLTYEQWEAVKKASDTRQDSDAPCSICLDDFHERAQVILSCSHVFHAECLRSFERFADAKRCPLCRTPSYDATPHFGGFMVWRVKCACRIQRAWRGHSSRSEIWHKQLMQPEGIADAPVLRRKFCGRALRVAGDRLGKACEEREDALDRFLESLDANVAQCSEQLREGLLGFEQLHGQAIQNQSGGDTSNDASHQNQDTEIITSATGAVSVPSVATVARSSSAGGAASTSADDWAKAREMAIGRGEEVDCPICFQTCNLRGRCSQRVELLSCSHVFHRCCIMSFESFHVFEVHICPVCRQPYERRPFNAQVVSEGADSSTMAAAPHRSSGRPRAGGRPPLVGRAYGGHRIPDSLPRR